MRLEFYPNRQQPPRKGILYLDKIQLNPGINDVSDDIKKHPSFANLLKDGAIVILKKTRDPPKSKDSGNDDTDN